MTADYEWELGLAYITQESHPQRNKLKPERRSDDRDTRLNYSNLAFRPRMFKNYGISHSHLPIVPDCAGLVPGVESLIGCQGHLWFVSIRLAAEQQAEEAVMTRSGLETSASLKHPIQALQISDLDHTS